MTFSATAVWVVGEVLADGVGEGQPALRGEPGDCLSAWTWYSPRTLRIATRPVGDRRPYSHVKSIVEMDGASCFVAYGSAGLISMSYFDLVHKKQAGSA